MCMHMYMWSLMYNCVATEESFFVCVRVCVCATVSVYACECACMFECVHVCVHVKCVCVCVCVCVHALISQCQLTLHFQVPLYPYADATVYVHMLIRTYRVVF